MKPGRLSYVFDKQRRPWIIVENGSPDEISELIERCPTGALHFRRRDGGPQERVPEETTVQERPNGPLLVHGKIRIFGPDRKLVREDTRVALCRCGASQNKPFCDGSHRRVEFRTTRGPTRAEVAMTQELDREGVRRLMAQGAQIIDVLPSREYGEDHLPGAVNLPIRKIEAEASRLLDHGRPIVVYCADSA